MAGLALATVIVSTTPLAAHTTVVDSVPAQGEIVSSLDVIEVTFASPVLDDGAAVLALQTPAGVDIPIGAAELTDGTTLRADVPDPPEAGSYVVRYEVTSADGDVSTGSFLFDYEPERAASDNAHVVLLAIGAGAMIVVVVLLWAPRRRRGVGDTDGPTGTGAVV